MHTCIHAYVTGAHQRTETNLPYKRTYMHAYIHALQGHISAAKQNHTYDEGIVDIAATGVRLVEEKIICRHVFMCVCIYIYIYVCIYVYIYMHMYVCMYAYMYVCVYDEGIVDIAASGVRLIKEEIICSYVFIYMCVYLYSCMYVCMHVCMHA